MESELFQNETKNKKKTHAEIIRGCSKRQSESEYFENNLARIVV